MNYKSYKIARDIAWEVLIWLKIRELPIRIVDVCNSMGIEVVYDEKIPSGMEGYCTILDGTPFIALDPKPSRREKRFTAAHELGHILLGHVDPDYINTFRRDFNGKSRSKELEANIFAATLLAPLCVFQSLDMYNEEDIMKLCDFEWGTTEVYVEHLRELFNHYSSKKPAGLPMERCVLEQFQDFIRSKMLYSKNHPR